MKFAVNTGETVSCTYAQFRQKKKEIGKKVEQSGKGLSLWLCKDMETAKSANTEKRAVRL